MNLIFALCFSFVTIYVTQVSGQDFRRNHMKCSKWADKFEICLKEGYNPTKFLQCEIGTKRSRHPYCTRFENYLASRRCNYDCPKSETGRDCDYATRRCSMDEGCSGKLEVYQRECELMQKRNMTSCTESCFRAYHHLRMDKYGGMLEKMQCDGLGVKNVKYSCIKEPASQLCVQSVRRCSDHCKALANDVSKKCLVGFADAECTDECRNAFLAIQEDEGSAEVIRDCHGVGKVLGIKCNVLV